MSVTVTGVALTAVPTAAPALEAAQRIADVFVAEHGVAEVAVFGSVARGDSTPDSDIDLVVIYPDMDYTRRSTYRHNLSSVARTIAGREVDVWVTDWAEWKLRSSEVTVSFEHGILDDCIVLARQHTPYQHICKTKIGLPMNDKEEISRRLQDCKKAIGSMDRTIPVSPFERDAMLEKDEEQREWRLSEKRIERLRDAAAAAALGIEHALKVLVALEGHPVPKTHSALDLIALLPDFMSSQLLQLLTEQEWQDIGDWRQAGTYIDAWQKLELSELEVVKSIERYYHTIIVILPFSVEEYEKRYGTSRFTDGLRRDLTDLDKRFGALDLLSGLEKQVHDQLSAELSRKFKWFRRRRKRVNPNQPQLPM